MDHTPPGARPLDTFPDAAAPKKLDACLRAMNMRVFWWELGGGQACCIATRPELRMAVEVRYDVGETPTGKVSAKFAGARVIDPIGIVVNLEFDYSIGTNRRKDLGMLPEVAERRASELSAAYNDGAQHVSNRANFATASSLNEWLDDWLDTLKIDHKRQSAKKKPKPTDLDMMMGADWNG